MTAVEWYAQQSMRLEIEKAKGNISISQMLNSLTDILNQALQMEKEQIGLAHLDGGKNDRTSTQYYNETFKQHEQ